MTFSVFGVTGSDMIGVDGCACALVAASCRSCGLPILLRYQETSKKIDARGLEQWLTQSFQYGHDLANAGLKTLDVWPASEGLVVPGNMPAEVERSFSQAEDNFQREGNEEAAALMYRRAMELALKSAYPDLKGTPASKVRELIANNKLPAAIGDWLTQVRLIGNDGAHEAEGVTRADLNAARGFVDTALRYIFTMPAQVAARRGLPPSVA